MNIKSKTISIDQINHFFSDLQNEVVEKTLCELHWISENEFCIKYAPDALQQTANGRAPVSRKAKEGTVDSVAAPQELGDSVTVKIGTVDNLAFRDFVISFDDAPREKVIKWLKRDTNFAKRLESLLRLSPRQNNSVYKFPEEMAESFPNYLTIEEPPKVGWNIADDVSPKDFLFSRSRLYKYFNPEISPDSLDFVLTYRVDAILSAMKQGQLEVFLRRCKRCRTAPIVQTAFALLYPQHLRSFEKMCRQYIDNLPSGYGSTKSESIALEEIKKLYQDICRFRAEDDRTIWNCASIVFHELEGKTNLRVDTSSAKLIEEAFHFFEKPYNPLSPQDIADAYQRNKAEGKKELERRGAIEDPVRYFLDYKAPDDGDRNVRGDDASTALKLINTFLFIQKYPRLERIRSFDKSGRLHASLAILFSQQSVDDNRMFSATFGSISHYLCSSMWTNDGEKNFRPVEHRSDLTLDKRLEIYKNYLHMNTLLFVAIGRYGIPQLQKALQDLSDCFETRELQELENLFWNSQLSVRQGMAIVTSIRTARVFDGCDAPYIPISHRCLFDQVERQYNALREDLAAEQKEYFECSNRAVYDLATGASFVMDSGGEEKNAMAHRNLAAIIEVAQSSTLFMENPFPSSKDKGGGTVPLSSVMTEAISQAQAHLETNGAGRAHDIRFDAESLKPYRVENKCKTASRLFVLFYEIMLHMMKNSISNSKGGVLRISPRRDDDGIKLVFAVGAGAAAPMSAVKRWITGLAKYAGAECVIGDSSNRISVLLPLALCEEEA